MAEAQRTVLLSGVPLSYTLERKNVKNLNLRIYPDGSVRVSANRRVPIREIEAFLIGHEDFIRNAQSRFREQPQAAPQQYVTGERLPFLGEALELQVVSGEREAAALENGKLVLTLKNPEDFSRREKLVNRFWDTQCQAVFPEILQECYPLFQDLGVPYPTLRIRSMKSRWGSCLPGKGIITLSKQLLAAPRECIRYVVVHEYCHFLHPNHGKGFHALLADRMPDWKERKIRLNGGGR